MNNYTITKFLDIKPENLNKIKVLNNKIDLSGNFIGSRAKLHLEMPLNIIPDYRYDEENLLTQLLDYFHINDLTFRTFQEPIKVAFATFNSTITELSFISWLVTDIQIDEADGFIKIIIWPDDVKHNTTYLS